MSLFKRFRPLTVKGVGVAGSGCGVMVRLSILHVVTDAGVYARQSECSPWMHVQEQRYVTDRERQALKAIEASFAAGAAPDCEIFNVDAKGAPQ